MEVIAVVHASILTTAQIVLVLEMLQVMEFPMLLSVMAIVMMKPTMFNATMMGLTVANLLSTQHCVQTAYATVSWSFLNNTENCFSLQDDERIDTLYFKKICDKLKSNFDS